MVRKFFFIGFGAFTLICCVFIFMYGGYSSLIFLPLGLSLLITGIKLKGSPHVQKRKLLLKRIALSNFTNFHGRHELKLQSGFNLIYGPGGSGKTNLGRAFRFAILGDSDLPLKSLINCTHAQECQKTSEDPSCQVEVEILQEKRSYLFKRTRSLLGNGQMQQIGTSDLDLDRFFTLIMDALYIFPGFIFVLILSVLLGPGIWQTALAVSMGRIPANFRMIRSITLTIKERGFIEAERILGASNLHIIRRHIAPYYVSILFVTISLGLARGTLAISGLGFLGLGIPPPTPEWGTELALGRSVLLRGAWWNVVFPGIFVLIAMLAFNLLSEGLDVIMNPTVRKLK